MNTKRGCLYAGSFDPPTNGHAWIIKSASNLFDKLYVAVGVNPDKKSTGLFTIAEREQMLGEIVVSLNNVSVISFVGAYQVSFAHSLGANYLLRGIRNVNDYVLEHTMRDANADICCDIETVFLIPPSHLTKVSSSFVRGLVGFEGWETAVSKYVPVCVLKMLKEKHELGKL